MNSHFQKVLKEILKKCKDEKEAIEAFYDFVREKIKYKFTIIGDPEKILERRYGACVDKSLLFAQFLKGAGIKVRYRFYFFPPASFKETVDFFQKFLKSKFLATISAKYFFNFPGFHVFNEINLEGVWKSLDTSIDSELEKILIKKNCQLGNKEGWVIKTETIQDLGSFEKIRDSFSLPVFQEYIKFLDKKFLNRKFLFIGINLANLFLYSLRQEKNPNLKRLESIEEILSVVKNFKY